MKVIYERGYGVHRVKNGSGKVLLESRNEIEIHRFINQNNHVVIKAVDKFREDRSLDPKWVCEREAQKAEKLEKRIAHAQERVNSRQVYEIIKLKSHPAWYQDAEYIKGLERIWKRDFGKIKPEYLPYLEIFQYKDCFPIGHQDREQIELLAQEFLEKFPDFDGNIYQ